MVAMFIGEGLLDRDLYEGTRPDGSKYFTGKLVWYTGHGENRKRNYLTMFFSDGFGIRAYSDAKRLNIHEGSHIVVTGELSCPSAEKPDEDGVWRRPKDVSLSVVKVNFAGGCYTKSEEHNSGDSGEGRAPMRNTSESKPAANAAPKAEQMPAKPVQFEEESLSIKNAGDLPF